jgi:PIN domain nuclease of toxin-antitoxin system
MAFNFDGRKSRAKQPMQVLATDHNDPGGCFLIATARLKQIPIVTRDSVMRTIAAVDPDCLAVVVC